MESIYIKNMVCDRCIAAVKKAFVDEGVLPISVALGEVVVGEPIDSETYAEIAKELLILGFEIVTLATPILVTKVKASIISIFDKNEVPENFKLSTFLKDKFHYDYSHLSRVFSHHEGDTIEHYVIKIRIEKAKELLAYKEQNISEVAYNLGYSSAAHFSRQFKELVGVSPSYYKSNPKGRNSLEDV